MEFHVRTSNQLKDNANADVQERLSFDGDQEQFNIFCNNLNEGQLKNVKELEISVKPKKDSQNQRKLEEQTNFQGWMKTCLCCAALHDACPGFMCCLDCLICLIFFWILCPVFCCWAYCKGKAIQESVNAIYALKEETYERMKEIGEKTKLTKVSIQVVDLTLDSYRIGHLRRLIRKSEAEEFKLKNNGLAVQAKEQSGGKTHYEIFQQNCKEITCIQGLKYDLQWGEVKLSN